MCLLGGVGERGLGGGGSGLGGIAPPPEVLLSVGSGPLGAKHGDKDAMGGFAWGLVFLLALSLPAELESRGLRCLAREVTPPPRLSQHSLTKCQPKSRSSEDR